MYVICRLYVYFVYELIFKNLFIYIDFGMFYVGMYAFLKNLL
jgi:hypothetical protein